MKLWWLKKFCCDCIESDHDCPYIEHPNEKSRGCSEYHDRDTFLFYLGELMVCGF